MSVATLVPVASRNKKSGNEESGKTKSSAELDLAAELVRQAKEAGVSLTGPGHLLKQFTKIVLETAPDE